MTESKISRLSKLNQTHDMKLLVNNLQMISPLESKRTNRKWKLLIEVFTCYEVKFDEVLVGLRDIINLIRFSVNWAGY